MFAKWVLGIDAVIFMVIGVLFWFAPVSNLSYLGVEELSAPMATDIRAIYGGLDFAVGMFFGWCLLRRERIAAGLALGVFAYAGLVLSRFTGMMLDDTMDVPAIRGLMVAEVLGLAFTAWAYRSWNNQKDVSHAD